MNNDDDISSLLEELSSFEMPASNTKRAVNEEEKDLKEEELQQYFLNKTKTLVDTTIGAIQDLTPGVVAGSDAREIEALSKLATSAAQALEALQRTSLVNKKADRDEQLEKIKIEGRKEIAQMQQKTTEKVTNNNILIASREEIMKKLLGGNNEVLSIE